jgi:hypothetical protein
MASARSQMWGPRAELGGDGGLILTAAIAVVLGLAALLGSGAHKSNVVWGALGLLAICVGPLIAWRLHGRRVDGQSTGGAVLGYIVGWVVVFALVILGALVARLAHLLGLFDTVDDAQQGVGLVLGLALASVYLAVAVWLDVEALRDLSATRRRHVPLDIARMVASVAYVAYAVGVLVAVTARSDPQAGMYTFLMLAAPGAVGAAVVIAADMLVSRDEQRSHGRLISGV